MVLAALELYGEHINKINWLTYPVLAICLIAEVLAILRTSLRYSHQSTSRAHSFQTRMYLSSQQNLEHNTIPPKVSCLTPLLHHQPFEQFYSSWDKEYTSCQNDHVCPSRSFADSTSDLLPFFSALQRRRACLNHARASWTWRAIESPRKKCVS